jgi:hypothetical protein
MAEDYCSSSDLYSFGLPRGALPNPGRLVSSVSASDNTLTLDQHGYTLNDPVSFRAEAGGSLPSPLVAATTYYAISVSENEFSVSATVSGSAVDLTTSGSRIVVIAALPIASAISWASRIIDDMLPAHLVPLEAPIHELVVMTCAELAVGKLLARAGSASKSLSEMVDAARKRLERWAKGVPLRGENVPSPANLAVSATVPFLDPRGWGRFGGL